MASMRGAPATGIESASSLAQAPRPFVVAHRFGNDIAALERAERAGVDLVEADVWRHRGRLVVRHDTPPGRLALFWDRWSPWRGRSPQLPLAELLRELDPGTLVMLDLKGSDLALPNELVSAFRAVRPAEELLVCSQNWALLEQFRPHAGVTLVHSIGNERQLAIAWDRLARDDHDAVSIDHRLLSSARVRELKARVSTVMTWTVNGEQQFQAVLGWGVDGVISDNLDMLRQFVERRDS